MILLDTHVLIWWINQTPNKLKPATITLIEETEHLVVSCISCLEVAWLAKHQRIYLELVGWIRRVFSRRHPPNPKRCMTHTLMHPTLATLAKKLAR